jgi:hypothetical protein
MELSKLLSYPMIYQRVMVNNGWIIRNLWHAPTNLLHHFGTGSQPWHSGILVETGCRMLQDLSPSPSGSENSEQKTILPLYGKYIYMAVCQNLVPLVNIKYSW